jgi:hypothetical protein
MENALRISKILLLILLPVCGFTQEPETGDFVLDEILVESAVDDSAGNTLILDNSRTKVGKDFYDLFYKQWTSQPTTADSSRRQPPAPAIRADDVLITIEELPSPGSGNLIQISIDDEPVWQQFVQARYDLLEVDATQAVAAIRSRTHGL